MASHHGRGNPAFTRQEAVDYLKQVGLAKSSELAEEFDVSDVAVRKRLKDMPGIESRKIRNRLVWYVPHEPVPAESDGYGSGLGLSVGGISPVAGAFAKLTAIIALVSAIGSIWIAGLQQLATVALAFSLVSIIAFVMYQDQADPSFEWKDWLRSIRESDRQ